MNAVVRVGLGLSGVVVVVMVLDSALRTFVVPRGVVSTLTRVVFRVTKVMFATLARPTRSYEARDRVMALYAPFTLLLLPIVWLGLIFLGFTGLFLAVGHGLSTSLRLSGSSLFTLGFDRPADAAPVALAFVEAVLGLVMVALLIAYLPTMYAAFSKREAMVSKLSTRAGTPPSSVSLIIRAQDAGFLDRLDPFFAEWEGWFVELEESHTSLGALSSFRSPNPHRSWITAAGCVLDTAALRYAALDLPFAPEAGLCMRSGFLALRAVATMFDLPFDPDPRASDPISIARSEFDEACDELAAAGLALRADRDEAWTAYAGWRVNYDAVLLELCGELMAPYAPWSSDRSLRTRVPLRRRRVRPVAPPPGRPTRGGT